MHKQKIVDPDVFDILSAAWIMSAHDENEIITYESIKYRLQLPKEYDVKSLIRARGDLFRMGVHHSRLEEWKKDMLKGKRLASWIRDIKDENVQKKIIENLTKSDVFRNQFRTKKNTPPLDIAVMDWGLNHIDRLRKASLEASNLSAIKMQMFFVVVVSVVSSVVTILITIFK